MTDPTPVDPVQPDPTPADDTPDNPQPPAEVHLPTQVKYPWRATARTVIQMLPIISVIIVTVVNIINDVKPEWVEAWGPAAIAASTIITRIMQNPTVDQFLTQLNLGTRPKVVSQ